MNMRSFAKVIGCAIVLGLFAFVIVAIPSRTHAAANCPGSPGCSECYGANPPSYCTGSTSNPSCPGSPGCPECTGANAPSYCKPATAAPIPDLPVNPAIPGSQTNDIATKGPTALVGNFYTFAFGIAGFLAFAMIVYGGARYALSAGNHSAQSDAKEAIKSALLGLALLFGAYLILRTINPDLTTLKFPVLDSYVPTPVAGTGPTGNTTTTPQGACASGSCTCGQYLAAHGQPGGTCTVGPGVQAIVSCVSGRIGVGPAITSSGQQATIYGTHDQNSCHFGGRSCIGIGHAVDYGKNGAATKGKTLEEVAAAVTSCGAGSGHQIACYYEDESGNRPSTNTSAVTHIHCDVDNIKDNCGCQ